MFSQDDDSQQRVALFLVFGLVALVVASVLSFAVLHRGASAQAADAQAPAALTTEPADSTSASLTDTQAVSDAASVQVERGLVKFYFASGKADLATGASEALAEMVESAQAGRKLIISGFHDATGGAAQNAELAKQRALAVRDALKTAGVSESQIELKKPKEITGSGSKAEARRVEITIQ